MHGCEGVLVLLLRAVCIAIQLQRSGASHTRHTSLAVPAAVLPRPPCWPAGPPRPRLNPPMDQPQNKFLQPDAAVVDALVAQLQAKRIGVVAHFYMDPEVQGVLSSAGGRASSSDSKAVAWQRCRVCCARQVGLHGSPRFLPCWWWFVSQGLQGVLSSAGARWP